MQFLGSLLTAEMISRMPYFQGIGLNLRVLSFGAAVAAAVAVVLTLTPLARISASSHRSGVDDGSRGTAGTTWRRMGAPLVVAQLAVAVVLLVGAGLLGRSLHRLINVDVGFTMQDLAAVSVSLGPGRIAGAADSAAARARQGAEVARQIADRVTTVPGVQSVGYADLLPLSPGLAPSSTFWVVGRAEDQQRREDWPVRRVSARYFATLKAKPLRGRVFTDEEAAAGKPVIIINESAARRYFQGEDPIGQSIAFGGPTSPRREIVGIVANIKDGPPETPEHPSGYVPFDQPAFALAIRLSPSTPPPAAAIRSAIREVRPDALIGALEFMAERANRLPSTSLHRSTAWLVAGFAAIACVLSVLGLYGVVAYSVGRRRRELGVRIALGAQPRALYRLVLGEALRLTCSGIALGAGCAVVAATLIRDMLADVATWDPPTLVGAGVILFLSALTASYVPARRAASVDPVEALRSE
jgi:predicted permease